MKKQLIKRKESSGTVAIRGDAFFRACAATSAEFRDSLMSPKNPRNAKVAASGSELRTKASKKSGAEHGELGRTYEDSFIRGVLPAPKRRA